jgi:chromate transporter
MLLAPMAVVLALTALYGHLTHYPMVAGALRGMGAVAAALVLATALKLLGALRGNVLGLPVCLTLTAATALAVGLLRWPMVWVILGLGVLAFALARWRLRGAT